MCLLPTASSLLKQQEPYTIYTQPWAIDFGINVRRVRRVRWASFSAGMRHPSPKESSVCVCVWTIDRTLRLSNSNNITTTLSWRSKSEKKIKPRREREREGERRRKKERADAVDIIIPWMQPLCRLGLCLCVSRAEPSGPESSFMPNKEECKRRGQKKSII